MGFWDVFCNSGLLNLIQHFTPTHRLARTCKRINEARDLFPGAIQYTLTFIGSQRYLRSSKFREELRGRGIQTAKQLRLRCRLEDDDDDGNVDADDKEFKLQYGPLKKTTIREILCDVKEYEIAVYTKSFWCGDVFSCIDWSKVVRFDGPRYLDEPEYINFAGAINMADLALNLGDDYDHEYLDKIPQVKALYLKVHDMPGNEYKVTNGPGNVEDLVLTAQGTLELNGLGVLAKVRRVVAGFDTYIRKDAIVARHLPSCFPNVVSVNMVSVGFQDLKPLQDLKYLRSLAINEVSLSSLPVLKLNRLCVFSSRNQFSDPDRVLLATKTTVDTLVSKQAELKTIEEMRLENMDFANFEFTGTFANLKFVTVVAGRCQRNLHATFYKFTEYETIKKGQYGAVQILEIRRNSPERFALDLDIHDF